MIELVEQENPSNYLIMRVTRKTKKKEAARELLGTITFDHIINDVLDMRIYKLMTNKELAQLCSILTNQFTAPPSPQ